MLTPHKSAYLTNGRGLLFAMLGLLHGALWLGMQSVWVHPLILAHLGVFLIWQPLWRGEREVGYRALSVIAFAALLVMLWLNWWVMALWLTGLFGLVGGRVLAFRGRWARSLNLLVMAYLLAVLLLWVVPNLFAAQDMLDVGRTLMSYVLPMLLLMMMLIPFHNEPADTPHNIDFIYSLVLFMLLALLVLGSLAFMTLGQLDYLGALMRTLFLMGLILFALSALWHPRFGFGGLQVMFSRYLLNVGTPFEAWLAQLAEASQHEPDAAGYLARATELLVELPWLSGLSWQTAAGAGQAGHFSAHAVVVQETDLRLTLYARQALNPAVLLHIHLLAQMIGHFYQSKQREQTLRNLTHLQAVYETGSRLTHDLKNILQSLLSLTALAQNKEARAQQLLQQQLPLLGQRIELTLNKLRQPEENDAEPKQSLRIWWGAAQQRHQHQAMTWQSDALSDTLIPAALFDCVLDNLLDNALSKQRIQPNLHINVSITVSPCQLNVRDTGTAIPQEIAEGLMRRVVTSQNGLGVGLYQAARWAEQQGYCLALVENQDGNVAFEMCRLQSSTRSNN